MLGFNKKRNQNDDEKLCTAEFLITRYENSEIVKVPIDVTFDMVEGDDDENFKRAYRSLVASDSLRKGDHMVELIRIYTK